MQTSLYSIRFLFNFSHSRGKHANSCVKSWLDEISALL